VSGITDAAVALVIGTVEILNRSILMIDIEPQLAAAVGAVMGY